MANVQIGGLTLDTTLAATDKIPYEDGATGETKYTTADSILPPGSVEFADLLATIFSGQITSATNGGTAGGTMKYINLGGIKLLWGLSVAVSVGAGASVAATVNFPTSFFTGGTTPYILDTLANPTVSAQQFIYSNNISNTGVTLNISNNAGATTTAQHSYLVIGQ